MFDNYGVGTCVMCATPCQRSPWYRVALCSASCRYDYRYDAHLRRTYAIGLATHRAFFVDQHGRCPICWTDFGPYRLTEVTWVVDHDHGTGRVRGLLCPRCNFLLGRFQDSPSQLRNAAATAGSDDAGGGIFLRAAEYLERARAASVPRPNAARSASL